MKILYLKLVNFSQIFSGMKKKTFELDLRKSKNRIILLVGDNGTGKTTIMSQLHPFAYPGNMDIRNGPEMILEGANGLKVIHIQHEDTIYEIEHHYMFKTGKSVKSFIKKDGVELNPNGNVTSFREVLLIELAVEQDYLKLLRLGSNVTSFIDMKATERKNFTSDLLSDIDIYSKLYKKISEDVRINKSLLKTVADKIEKLRVYNEEEEIERMDQLEHSLKNVKIRRDDITGQIGQIDGSISVMIPNGHESFITDIKLTESTYKQLLDDIKKKNHKLEKLNIIFLGDIDYAIEDMKKKIVDNESRIATNKTLIDVQFNQLNFFYTQKQEKENSMKYITSELEYGKISDLLLELHREKEKLDERFKNFSPRCTKEELLTALGLLQEIQKFIEDVQEHNTNAVAEVVGLLLEGTSVESVVRQNVTRLDDKINQLNLQLQRTTKTATDVDPNKVYVLYQPEGCECVCPFRGFYEDVMGIKKDSPTEQVQTELKKSETRREYYLEFTDIAKRIDYIFVVLKTNRLLIEKIPEDFFNINKILKSIRDFIPFYDEDFLTNYVAAMEEYEEYKKLEDRIKEVRKEKSFIEKNGNTMVNAQKELETIDNEIYRLEKELQSLRDSVKELTEENEELEETLLDYTEYKEIRVELDEIRDSAKDVESKIDELNLTRVKLNEMNMKRREWMVKLQSVDREIQTIEDEINTTRYNLMQFKSLKEEQVKLEEEFDDINIIREALSSTKGIPLLFIQLYLKNTRMMVNQLLETVYQGELEIGEFVINEKEFRIPYTKNGLSIDDVAKSSQGEKSFISLALSFALIEQSIDKYNVMLLDEIDSTLDTKNRALFLAILEKQLESINSEQVFMITHNNMFDNYPVDIICTSSVDIDNLKNANIIYRAT